MDHEAKPDQAKLAADAPPKDGQQTAGRGEAGASVPLETPPDPGCQPDPADPPAKEGKSLLKEEKPKTTHISKHKLAYALGGIIAVVTFGIGRGMSTGSKQPVREANVQQAQSVAANAQSPKPPEGLQKVAGKYPDLLSPGVAGARAQSAAAQGGAPGPGAAPVDGATSQGATQAVEQTVGGSGFSGSGGRSNLTTQDQRQKDRISASRAPVAFEGKDTRPQDTAPQRDTGAPPLDPGGLNRILDRVTGGLGAGAGEGDDQNRQGEKKVFTKENRDDFPYLKTTLLTPISKYEVKAGSIIPGVLLTGINSDLPGQITAQVRENVYDTVSGRYLLIPQGSRLIGEYDSKISYGQERVLIVWTRIIMPNGNSIGLEGMPGIDLSGYAGVSGKVNNHYGKLITGVVLGSVIGAGAQVAVGGQGAPNVPPSFPQLFVAGAAGNINQAGQQITQKNLNLQPTLEVAPGQRINIFLTKDLILRPYSE
jgi:type IV secretion system protein VirB10